MGTQQQHMFTQHTDQSQHGYGQFNPAQINMNSSTRVQQTQPNPAQINMKSTTLEQQPQINPAWQQLEASRQHNTPEHSNNASASVPDPAFKTPTGGISSP